MQARDQDVPGEMLHEILKEIDLNRNGQVEFDEYLQVIISAFFDTVLMCVTCAWTLHSFDYFSYHDSLCIDLNST